MMKHPHSSDYPISLDTAVQLLKRNQFQTVFSNNRMYKGISPSNEYYHHAWFWDSVFHAMALAHSHPQTALEQLRFLTDSQWENGHIGHIIYRAEDAQYFPGKDIWGTEGKSKSGIISSGIIQPPILAIGLRSLYKSIDDDRLKKQLLFELLPKVEKYHHYIKKTHDSENSGLITIFHPWSSGSDNSIAFDFQMQAIKLRDIPEDIVEFVKNNRRDHTAGDSDTRPIPEDYYRFIYLIYLGKNFGWDYEKMNQDFPFAVKDISVNALWCYANEALGELLTDIGQKIKAKTYFEWADETRHALQTCWKNEHAGFTNINVAKGQWKPHYTERFANFMPFLSGEITPDQLDVLFSKLLNPKQYWTDYPIPSVPIDSEKFEQRRYWRGPSWPAVTYFIILGLGKLLKSPIHEYTNSQKKQLLQTQKILKERLEQMIKENGFYENFTPIKNKEEHQQNNGNGFSNFSWTAAIFILLSYI